MPIPIENNSWDYVQRLIEREINSAFKLRQESDKMKHNKKEGVYTTRADVQQYEDSQPHKLDGIYFQVFTLEEVKEINKEILKIESSREPPGDAALTTKIGEFSTLQCMPLMELVHPWLFRCQIANRETFGFDIDWHFHLDYFNYNVYGPGGEYNWHIDGNRKGLLDMKLTCLLNLSEEPYEGGDFEIWNTKMPFDSGMGLVINSMQIHRVTPVTKGKRITLTYWGLGPGWR